MKHAKYHGVAGGSGTGISGLLRNIDALRTKHERAMFLEVTFSMADMLKVSDSVGKHKDNRPSEIQKIEKMVSTTMNAININPFDVDDESRLYCISSGAPAPTNIVNNVLTAEEIGENVKELFIRERNEKKEKFFEFIKKLNLKTVSELNQVVKLKTSKNKVVEYKQQSNIAFQLLVKSQKQEAKLNIQHLLSYPLTTVPYSILTADGFLASTHEAKGFQHLVKGMDDAPFPPPSSTLTIIGGNSCFYYMTVIPHNFKLICLKVFHMIPKDADVIFSTDTYKKDSIKAMERKRRGCGEKLIVRGESTKKPDSWKYFLANDDKKRQLVKVMLDV